ncbi:MAG: hypothetical protein JWN86_1601 [Planctomycetota bacterium]|nr:hypothetical protein [Planctomycetota bacterium]
MVTIVRICFLLGLNALLANIEAQDVSVPTRQLKAMREIARNATMETAGGTSRTALIDEPIYKFNDPARRFSDGSVWAFSKTGRPAALYTLSLEKTPSGVIQWVHEFTSLSETNVAVKNREYLGGWEWAPEERGISMKPFSSVASPSDEVGKRSRQMRELARRFKAFELWEPSGTARPERYELRLLPQPVYRYSDPANGLIDGAIFFMVYGQNPEIALVIEARQEGKAAPTWSYGMGRIAAAHLIVSLDEHNVADWPRPANPGPKSAYAATARPANNLEK